VPQLKQSTERIDKSILPQLKPQSEQTQYGSVKGYAVPKTINTGGFIMIPVPLCLTCLERNFETGFLTTLGLFLAHSFRYNLSEDIPS
jgi:hypothetical protein